MQKVPYFNETSKFVHVGGVTIPPNETRDVDASLLPDYKPEGKKAKDPEPDHLADLLKGKVEDIVARLPTMTAEDLAALESLEVAGKSRKGLLEAIQAENLRRAQANLDPK